MRTARIVLVAALVLLMGWVATPAAQAYARSTLETPQGALLLAEYDLMAGGTTVGATTVAPVGTTVTQAAGTTVLPTTPGVTASTSLLGDALGGLAGAVGSVAGLFGIKLHLGEGADWVPPVTGGQMGAQFVKDTMHGGVNTYRHTSTLGGSFGGTSFVDSWTMSRVSGTSAGPVNYDMYGVQALCRTPTTGLNLYGCTSGASMVGGSMTAGNPGPTGTVNITTFVDVTPKPRTLDRVCIFGPNSTNAYISGIGSVIAPVTSCPASVGGFPLAFEWLATGHPGNAEVPEYGTITSTIICEGAGAPRTVTATGPSHTMANGANVVAPDVACAPGEVATSTRVDWTGGTSGKVVPLIPPVQAPEWVRTLPVEYPGCLGSTPCLLRLVRVDTQPEVDCTKKPDACLRWETDPERWRKYECRYGPYAIGLEYCAPFRTPAVPTYPGLDPLPDPDEIVGEESDCFPDGWGVFNPVQWVEKPVRCALVWAFVPDTAALQTKVDTMQGQWNGSALGTIAGYSGDVAAALDTWTGGDPNCAGPAFTIHGTGPISEKSATVRPLYACSAPWSSMATTVRTITIIGVWLACVTGCGLLLASTMGWRADA